MLNKRNVIADRSSSYDKKYFFAERQRPEGQEVRHGAEHQDGPDEADPGPPAAASQDVTATPSHRPHVSRLRRQHQLRGSRGHAQDRVPALRTHPVDLDELGPDDAEAQRLRVRRIRDSGSSSTRSRTGETFVPQSAQLTMAVVAMAHDGSGSNGLRWQW